MAATTGTRCVPPLPTIAEYFNAHPNLTADAGAVLFGDTVTITADGPWQHLLYKLTGHKWGNLDVENETGCGIVPYSYRPSNLVNAVQWAVGLELLLLIDDPWRCTSRTDHPNGACFWRYPEIIQLLMSAAFRKECLSGLSPKAASHIFLPEITREYTLYEIAIITSAGPARAWPCPRKATSASARMRTWSSTTRTKTSCGCLVTRAMYSRPARWWSKKGRFATWWKVARSWCSRPMIRH